MEQKNIQAKQRRGKGRENGKASVDTHVTDTEKTITEAVYHVENRVSKGNSLPDFGQGVDAVEHATEVSQGDEDEGGHDGNVIEFFRKQGVEEAAEREGQGGEDGEGDNDEPAVDLEFGEQQGDDTDGCASQQTTKDASACEAEHDAEVTDGGDQQFFDAFLEFKAEERRADVHVGVGNDTQHNQAWRDELHVGEAFRHADFITDELAKDDKIQRHSDGGGND